MRFAIGLAIAVAVAGGAFALEGADVGARRVREAMVRLEGGEKEAADALDHLKAEPRALVIRVLKEDLASNPEPRPAVLRSVQILDAVECWPELLQIARKAENWQTFAAMNPLIPKDPKLRSEISEIYLTRLSNLLNGSAKTAVLDGLAKIGTPLPRPIWLAMLSDRNARVRISAVREFDGTRSSLPRTEQVLRFQEAFQAKPYQARLAALTAFAHAADREALKAAVGPEFCRGETQTAVQNACRRVRRSLGGEP